MQMLLEQLKIKADVISVETNGTMSKYYLRFKPDGRIGKLERCANEIALGLKSYSIPIIRIIPEQGLVSVELLIKPLDTVLFSNLVDSFNICIDSNQMQLPIILGKEHTGEDLIVDLALMPHLLIAGTTGSGKSVLLHSIICSLLQPHQNIKLALIDPKNVEFTCYKEVKQLMYPIINYADDAYDILSDLVEEMDKRFKIMAKSSVNTISAYNKKKLKNKMPYIVLIIDEFSDLIQISKKVFQSKLTRLAQKSRACGIHIIISTQRPSADVVTGIIKANFPARISCKVTSSINSRVVLDKLGAEKLLGNGDALLDSTIYDMLRFKGAFISPDEIKILCEDNKRSKFKNFFNYLRNI